MLTLGVIRLWLSLPEGPGGFLLAPNSVLGYFKVTGTWWSTAVFLHSGHRHRAMSSGKEKCEISILISLAAVSWEDYTSSFFCFWVLADLLNSWHVFVSRDFAQVVSLLEADGTARPPLSTTTYWTSSIPDGFFKTHIT